MAKIDFANMTEEEKTAAAYAMTLIIKHKREGSYGTVSFHYEKGKIVHTEQKITDKPAKPL